MKKKAFWLCTISNIVMIVYGVIGIIVECVNNGLSFDACVSASALMSDAQILETVLFVLLAIMLLGAYALLLFDFFIEHSIILKVLIVVLFIFPFVLLFFNISTGVKIGAFFLPVLVLLIDSTYRYKIIYLISMLVALLFGYVGFIMLVLSIVVLKWGIMWVGICVLAVLGIGGGSKRSVYDEFGNFLGHIYED